MYRTGDLARQNSEGELEYQGRNDFQIKIRGVRIEPGEIEAEMRKIPGIAGAAIMAHKTKGADSRLIGYYTCEQGGETTVVENSLILEFLESKLPSQMIPSEVIRLEEFPLNPSGKLDRNALPKPLEPPTQNKESVSLIKTETEASLVELWKQLLGVVHLSVEDDFFDRAVIPSWQSAWSPEFARNSTSRSVSEPYLN